MPAPARDGLDTGSLIAQNVTRTMSRPKKSPAQKRAALAVYLPPKLLRKLQRVAERERRSASAQALLYLEKALAKSAE